MPTKKREYGKRGWKLPIQNILRTFLIFMKGKHDKPVNRNYFASQVVIPPTSDCVSIAVKKADWHNCKTQMYFQLWKSSFGLKEASLVFAFLICVLKIFLRENIFLVRYARFKFILCTFSQHSKFSSSQVLTLCTCRANSQYDCDACLWSCVGWVITLF